LGGDNSYFRTAFSTLRDMTRNLPLIFTLLASFFLINTSLFAQGTATVRGVVVDKFSTQPMPFVTVYLKKLEKGTTTDENGHFQFSKLPATQDTLVISYVGYTTEEIPINITNGAIIDKRVELTEGVEMKGVEISADRQDAINNVKISITRVDRKDISRVPAIGGEADIATYFQTVPGVVSTGDQGGQLYVRGGAPIQNKVLLDGMIIYNPFHSIGFFSVFDTDIIRTADIYTGGFNAEHGGRISSVMEITTRDGNAKEFSGKLSASPFGAKALIEGPLKKVNAAGSSISYLLSAKTSYLAQSSKVLYKYVDTAGLPFSFTDVYGKLSFNGQNGSKFNLFGFRFTDQVKYQSISDLHWDSWGVGSNFVLVPAGNPVLVSGDFSYSHYGITLDDGTNAVRTSEIDGFNISFDFKYFLPRDEVKYGIDVEGFRTDFLTYNITNRIIRQEANTTQLGGYVSYRINRGRLVLEPSFRAMYYASLATKFSPEPRFGFKFNWTENFRVKGATGVYSQNFIASNSDRDVVNLFYGFLSGTENLQDTYVDEDGNVVDRKHALQKAVHYILGFEYDLNKYISFNVEGYIKDFTQLTNTNRNKIYDENEIDQPEVLRMDFIIETGFAKGVDFVVKFNNKNTYLWLGYSLGKVTRWDGIQTYAPIFDRRHNVNLIFTQTFGKDNLWELNLRWNYGSGLPFTQTAGYYMNVNFNDVNSDYVTSNANEVTVLYSGLNQGRLSDYHRMDFALKRKFEFKKTYTESNGKEVTRTKSTMEVIFGVTNTYNRENIFYVNRITGDRVYQLPIIPTLGFNWAF
jgi:hypothetical protein